MTSVLINGRSWYRSKSTYMTYYSVAQVQFEININIMHAACSHSLSCTEFEELLIQNNLFEKAHSVNMPSCFDWPRGHEQLETVSLIEWILNHLYCLEQLPLMAGTRT